MALPVTRPRRADAQQTRSRILDAAQELFADIGYGATSVRAITDLAGVNLAAVNYHFGSKEGVLGACVHRLVEPINQVRLALLDQLECAPGAATPRQILEAFFLPVIEMAPSQLPRLIARLYGESKVISQPLLEREFGPMLRRFINALVTVMPDTPEYEIQWRFHFMVGTMIQFLNFQQPPGMQKQTSNHELNIARLIDFATAGMEQTQSNRQGEFT